MSWFANMNETIKKGIRSWLNITPATSYNIQITEMSDFETSAIRNRIWYRGDGNELQQLYSQTREWADKYKFWACASTPGMEIRKIHTGLPGMIVRVLTSVVLADMDGYDFNGDEIAGSLWDELLKENDFDRKMKKALQETLYIGDGAFKITIDTEASDYPILEWYPGDCVEIVKHRDRVQEVIFKTPYRNQGRTYTLNERYGRGYIINELYLGEKMVDLASIPETAQIKDWQFDKELMLAVPFKVYESSRYEGRGASIFDGKLDSFDAFDEAWSQWMDALRAGRAKTYIPDSLIPRDPETGALMRPNPFDNRFVAMEEDGCENAQNKIDTEQPTIPHESYVASYVTALDLCLQGIISPSTLGIDVKKLDNAEAQREKEKVTLYTRNAIVEALQDMLPKLAASAINAYNVLHGSALQDIHMDVTFGEYANPSFESQVETVVKAKQGGIMSTEAAVEELYGDTRDAQWKSEEVARLREEQGISELEEPALNLDGLDMQGGTQLEGEGSKQNVSDEPEGVPGSSGSGV